MATAIDLFSGFGGWSSGAKKAGIKVKWAGNHWPEAVYWHRKNHPDTIHVCQNLHHTDWSRVPEHDIMLASPCCQGHSNARGKEHGNPKHDASRSTANVVVEAMEFHRPRLAVIENVVEFLSWALYPAWHAAITALGYQVSPHVVDCADLGVPQNRVRLFLVCSRSRAPIKLKLPKLPHVPAASFIDFDAGNWSPIDKPSRSPATLTRIANGRARYGDRFLAPYYGSGSGKSGRSIHRPIGTITTLARWAVIDGARMRMLSAAESLAAMSFPRDMQVPTSEKLTIHMAGNAVPPLAGARILSALLKAA